MKTNMLITSALVAILCLVAMTTAAFVRKDKGQGTTKDGLVLTDLWKEYAAAQKSDRPKEMAAVLDAIISKAKAERLNYDFYSAANAKMTVESARNWKVADEYRRWLDKEIEEYNEPIVTFRHWLINKGASSLTEYVFVNKTRLQTARNEAFYGGELDELWTGMIKDDYEYALWILAVVNHSERAMSALKEYVGETYPKAAYLEFRGIADKEYSRNDKGRAEKSDALKAFARKYEGRAVSLYAEAAVLQARFDSLSRLEGSSAAFRQAQGPKVSESVEATGHVPQADSPTIEASYKALYQDCKLAEKERLSYSKGIDKEIAGKMDDFGRLIESLDRKEIKISFRKNVAVLTLRNISEVDIEFTKDEKNARPLLKRTVNNPVRSFYVQDTIRFEIPKCDDGAYMFMARNGRTVSEAKLTLETLSIAVREDSEGWRFYVADYLTGKPLDKVDLKLLGSGKMVAEAKDVELCKDGFIRLPEAVSGALKDGVTYYLVASCRDQDGLLRKTDEQYLLGHSFYDSSQASSGAFCEIFTDKSAYNPGEQVEFKAVLYKGDMSRALRVFEAGAGVKAELVNPDGKTVCEKELITNEYGSVAGSFCLPVDEKNGGFQIRISGDDVNSSKGIVVDEFVLPTYDLKFDRRDDLFIVGDTVCVSGKVFSFSGHSLSSAKVVYSVVRSGAKVDSGALRLGPDGSFKIIFATEDNNDYRNVYEVKVKVTDSTGETKEFSKKVLVFDCLFLNLKVENAAKGDLHPSNKDWRGEPYMVSGGNAVVSFRAEALGGNEVKTPSGIRYSLRNMTGETILSGVTTSGKSENIALPESGMYCLDAESKVTREDGREVSSKRTVMILRLDDSDIVVNAKVQSLFKLVGRCADGALRTGDDIEVQFAVTEGPVWAVVELFGDRKQLLEHKMVCLDGKVGEPGSLARITYNYKAEYPDAVRLNVFFFRGGVGRTFSEEFRRERKNLDLPLTFSSFTDKTLPGKEYSFAMKSVSGVEAVAAVFDKSSEVIAANDWSTVRLSDHGADDIYLNYSTGGIRGHMLYGDMFVRGLPRNARARGLGGDRVALNSALEASDAGAFYAEEAIPFQMAKHASLEDGESVDVPDVEARADFSSTLAFEPFLRSDADGNIFLKFRTSDRLSTFVVQVWAHTQDMLNACVRKEMVVTVPVKVSVAEPKYLYKGDRFVLCATVSNGSDKDVTGVAALQAYSSKDYEGEKPFASLSKKVTVPAGGSVAVGFDVDPKNFDELGLKVVFADDAKTFSDGVFVSLPVHDAKQTLTESHSAVLLAGMDRKALIRRLESEFTGTTSKGAEVKDVDLRQMVLDAVSSKAEPVGKDVLSLTEALYVRKVAASLGTKVEAEMSDEVLLEKVKACLNADGGFGWFEGMRSSPVVTAVVLERLAKMRDAGFDFGGIDLTGSVKWLDRNQFLHGAIVPRWCDWLSMEQYAYIRSLYSSVPFDVSPQTKNDKSEYVRNFKEFKKLVRDYLVPSANDDRGLNGQILAKARRIKTLANLVNNEGGLALASAWGLRFSSESRMNQSIDADILSLLEYAVRHPDGGWYYPNAVMPWRGLLESEAYAHAMLCDLLSSPVTEPVEVTGVTEGFGATDVTARQIADGIRLWLMLQKETQKWDEDPAFVDAFNSILSGPQEILATKVVTLTKTYSTPFSKIAASGNGFTIERHFYKEVTGEDGKNNRQEIFPGMKLSVGDKITAEYRIWSQENRSFVRLTAPREAAFRPSDQLSGAYGWWLRPLSVNGVLSVTPQGYRNVKTDRTEYYFDVYSEEKTTVTENFFITQNGTFTAPVVTIESLYAPHYRANASFGGALATSEM